MTETLRIRFASVWPRDANRTYLHTDRKYLASMQLYSSWGSTIVASAQGKNSKKHVMGQAVEPILTSAGGLSFSGKKVQGIV